MTRKLLIRSKPFGEPPLRGSLTLIAETRSVILSAAKNPLRIPQIYAERFGNANAPLHGGLGAFAYMRGGQKIINY